MQNDKLIIETYGELAAALDGISVSWTKELWRRHGFKLKHRLGARGRIKMTESELAKFRSKIQGEIEC